MNQEIKTQEQIWRLYAIVEGTITDRGPVTVQFGRQDAMRVREHAPPGVRQIFYLFCAEITLLGAGVYAKGSERFALGEVLERDEKGAIVRHAPSTPVGRTIEWLLVPEGTTEGFGGDAQAYGQGRKPILDWFFGAPRTDP